LYYKDRIVVVPERSVLVSSARDPSPAELRPDDLRETLSRGDPVFILDVRTPEEFAGWHIPGAVNVPIDRVEADPDSVPVPTDRPVVAVCAHGNRSARATALLRCRGVDARNLVGGMVGWNGVYEAVTVPVGLPGVEVIQVRRPGKGCLSYLIRVGSAAVAVCPTVHVGEFIRLAAEREAKIVAVLDTHLHADHVSGARELAARTGAALLLSGREPYEFDGFVPIDDGFELPLAGGISLFTLLTPGHTPGSITFRLGDAALFTGDTLFIESIGRPDLRDNAEAQARQLYRTYAERLSGLPAGMRVLPAHFGEAVAYRWGEPVADRLGAVLDRLPVIRLGEADFVREVLARLPEQPPNFRTIQAINRSGVVPDPAEVAELEAGPNRCAVRFGG
jgi:glyoxylase-like metal-dependent hydrolase (beta-lactamase superfamily II)/rhodanese-related sulfurtransferase